MKHLAERLERVKTAVLPKLTGQYGSEHFDAFEHRGELSIRVPQERIVDVLRYLRDEPSLRFDLLVDLCAVDWFRRKERFEMIYNLWSLANNMRLRVKCFVEEKAPSVDSITSLWAGADWYERETYDMHGIVFDGHPDLRRMYMPEDFVDP
ncbi:MAG: NADH-quinone oxidoreductase subunit C [bacterium]|nr:NADH-quinone oxidoreductase subunit C [Candidatus Kapabacteria bacterium]